MRDRRSRTRIWLEDAASMRTVFKAAERSSVLSPCEAIAANQRPVAIAESTVTTMVSGTFRSRCQASAVAAGRLCGIAGTSRCRRRRDRNNLARRALRHSAYLRLDSCHQGAKLRGDLVVIG